MKLLIVIVNFRTPELALVAAESALNDTAELDATLTIVDNCSGDGSYQKLLDAVRARDWSGRVQVLESGRNGGFGFGNNVALRRDLSSPTPADVFLLLNPDAVVVKGCCGVLMDHLDQHPEVGIAGPLVCHPDGRPQTSAFRFPGVLSEFERGIRFGPASRLLKRYMVAPPAPANVSAADWVSGAAFAVRREVLERVGMFDEKFFLYFEEMDLCRRALAAGFQIRLLPQARILHDEGSSTGITQRKRVPSYWFEARRYYFVKQHGYPYFLAASVAWGTGHVMWRVLRRVRGKPDLDPPRLLRDFVGHSLPWWRKDEVVR